MGRCIICGSSTDGRVCETHEEDVVFEFRGNRPDQLTAGRYYGGTVDGYADFGVFVNIGDHVTGLLHQSELDQRLESLEWEPGDRVYVKVQRVRDNGNVDLGWSIRQRSDAFRGKLIDKPGTETAVLPDDAGATSQDDNQPIDQQDQHRANGGAATETTDEHSPAEPDQQEEATEAGQSTSQPAREESTTDGGSPAPPESESAESALQRVAIELLDQRVGDAVKVEGEVVSVQQTGGPTIFELRDETGSVDVAAFAGAGVRAHPSVEAGDVIRVVGEVELRREELQLESQEFKRLTDGEAEAVQDRLETALAERATPPSTAPLAAVDAITEHEGDLNEAAKTIRQAVFESRPVVVRHPATTDGYVAGAAIERAVLPLVRDEHARTDSEYHYFDRRPMDDPIYTMADATSDVSSMLADHERHDEQLPLVILVGTGSSIESLPSIEFLSVYDVETVILNAGLEDATVRDIAGPMVVSEQEDGHPTTTAVAADLAGRILDEIRDDLRHLPAVSYWHGPPTAYTELAAEAGYDSTSTRELREAIALVAYYQTYEDKRQLVTDLLFGEAHAEGDAEGLAAHVSEQFRSRVNDTIETARENVDVRESGGIRFTVLDTDAYTDEYEFPPTSLLVDVLHRRNDGDEVGGVTVAVATDEIHLRADERIDLRQIAEHVRETVPNAGVRAVPGRTGRLEFVAGEREAVLHATVDAVAATL